MKCASCYCVLARATQISVCYRDVDAQLFQVHTGVVMGRPLKSISGNKSQSKVLPESYTVLVGSMQCMYQCMDDRDSASVSDYVRSLVLNLAVLQESKQRCGGQ